MEADFARADDVLEVSDGARARVTSRMYSVVRFRNASCKLGRQEENNSAAASGLSDDSNCIRV